ncbi:MAG: hypothetical protein HKP57_08115 [Halobacteria archaeon]|nr:hypothetical protein [Halobacteria archaeon]
MRVHPSVTGCLAALLMAGLLQGCAAFMGEAEKDRIFRGVASISKLAPAIRQSPLVSYCPATSIGEIGFTFRQFPERTASGRESFRVTERLQGIAGLSMFGDGHKPMGLPGIDDWSMSSGRIVSCGGLFTLAFSETQSPEHDTPECISPVQLIASPEHRSNRRYTLTQISDYTGGLFPLRVGNELTLSYSALSRSWSRQSGCVDSHYFRRMQYIVLSTNDAFTTGGKTIPGRVYLIERTLLDEAGGVSARRDYYFSDVLGWVVMEVEYENGLPVTVKEMVDWQRANIN